VRFQGIIESIGADTWVISGQSVLLTDATVIDQSAGKATEGASVWVIAERREGLLIATSITVEAPAPEIYQFSGIIESIQGGVWTIAGDHLSASDAIVSGDPARVGCLAHVSALRYPDGSLVVESILVECGELRDIEGVLVSKNGDLWQVGNTTVTVTGAEITGAQPEIGYWVEVRGYLQPDGSVLATWIRVLQPTATPTAVPPAASEPSQNGGLWSFNPGDAQHSDRIGTMTMIPMSAVTEDALPVGETGPETGMLADR
jgi:hypothetical protein